MMINIKKNIRNLLQNFGYDIIRINNNYQSNYSFYSKESLEEKRFYNIGAGSFFHPYWTNIDYSTNHYQKHQKSPFINHNLMDKNPLPLPDNCAEVCYSSHTIEHISTDAAFHMFSEIYRILKRGGGG